MKRIILVVLCLISFFSSEAQIISRVINTTYTSTTDTIYPFTNNDYCYGMSLEGNSRLFSRDGFIRVILVDINNEEWLIYERNNLFSTEVSDYFKDASFETFMLDSIIPVSIIIQSEYASLGINKLNINQTSLTNRASFQDNFDSVFIRKNIQLVDRINDTLSLYKKAWRADTTFLSNKRFQLKKEFFPEGMPNLEGWDYYAYGYYSPLNDNTPQASNNIVKEFDWRTRHGANISGSYYYNPDGSGWIPKRKDVQVAAECWAFATSYSVESMVNLYFNRQYNDELSVQDILSCSNGGTWYGGGYPETALNYVKNTGIVNRQCFPFQPREDIPCEEKCENPNEIVKISGKSNEIKGEDNIKRNLITEGVLVARVVKWSHAMSLVGYGVVKAGDMILNGNINYHDTFEVYVEEDSPDIGKPYYIFKQSHSSYGPDKTPFCKLIIDANNNSRIKCYSINTPIYSILYSNDGVNCVDFDGDGYYNWGIGLKPENCPECPNEIDSDDHSALLGPYNDKFESIVLCDNYVYSDVPEYIIGFETWNTKKHIDHNIIINDSCTLTITDSIYLGYNTKIIVKPGGKLILDQNSLLSSLCDNQWQGIEVWGVDTLHQYIVDGKYKQGYLELKNGATIENAICAVELWQPGNYHSEGGIIHATDAVFRNNAKAVHAINYTNYVPTNGNSSSYNSWFKNCEFIVDSDYIGDETFHKHIDLDRVNGISFKGCSFSVDRNVENVSQWCSGIAAYNAGFAVNSYCSDNTIQPCLDEYLTRSSFSGFHSGIYVRGGSTSYTYNVRNAEFTNNDRGIYAENTGYGTILKNDFNVGTNAGCNFGIYVSEVTSFCIEENNFHGNLQSTNDTYGIAVHNSNNYNSIYLNHFNNLTCGNIAIGNNKRPGIVSLSQSGIAYYCNTNTGNINDFCVIKDNSASVNGIARSQGSSAEAAGNTFSGSQYHFYNDGDDVINYYYSLSKFQQPHGDKLYRVTTIAANDGNDCSSHYGNNPVVKSDEEMTVLNNDYQTSLSAYNSLEQLYTSRIDGGDTQAELLDINTATADDASRLRSQLLGLSPYLSQEVLTTAASRNDVFSTSTLFEILSANPDELKKDTLISYLENKDNPMPEYMTELLREIANGSTARTALESQMAKYEREYILAAGDIVRSNLNSEESDNEELRLWLGNMNDMASDRLAIATYIQESDFENALALAETLPDVYALQGAELEEHNDYISILRLYETLDESGRDIMQLTETETEMLEEIADNGSGSSQMMAYAILSQNDETLVTAVNCPVLPTANNNSKRDSAKLKSDIASAMGMKADFAPNPATAWTEIDYTLPLDEEKASLVITNALGVNVMTVELNGNHGRKTLYIEQLPAGVYTYFVKCGEYTITGKLMKK